MLRYRRDGVIILSYNILEILLSNTNLLLYKDFNEIATNIYIAIRCLEARDHAPNGDGGIYLPQEYLDLVSQYSIFTRKYEISLALTCVFYRRHKGNA